MWFPCVGAKRLNERSECKKFLRLTSASDVERRQVLQQLMFWCSRASDFPRQRLHVAFTPTWEHCPSLDFLEQTQITDRPAFRDVATDVELDHYAVPMNMLPPANSEECRRRQAAPAVEPAEPARKPTSGKAKAPARAKPKAPPPPPPKEVESKKSGSAVGQGSSSSVAKPNSGGSSSSSSVARVSIAKDSGSALAGVQLQHPSSSSSASGAKAPAAVSSSRASGAAQLDENIMLADLARIPPPPRGRGRGRAVTKSAATKRSAASKQVPKPGPKAKQVATCQVESQGTLQGPSHAPLSHV